MLHWFKSPLAPIVTLAIIQAVCAGFFISEFLTEVLGLRRWALPFVWREALQVLASLGLVMGTVAAVLLLRQTRVRLIMAQRQLQAASGAFLETMDAFFEEWALSPSERDVALFAIRGMSNAEIANLRGKSEATIKTQINAIYRKADVSSRTQLLSLFVDTLINPAPD